MKTCIMVAGRAYGVFSSRDKLVATLIGRGWRVVVASNYDPTVPRLQALGAGWAEIPFQRGSVNISREIRATRALRALFLREQPTLVHVFGVKPMLLAGFAALPRSPATFVCNVTGLGYAFHTTRMRRWIASLMSRLLLSRNDAVVFQNPDDRDDFVARGIVPPDIAHVIVSSGVDVAQFCPALRAVPRDRDPIVLMASRLVWQKGVGEFIEAARTLKTRYPGVRFVLAGSLEEDHSDGVPRSVIDAAVNDGTLSYVGYVADMAERLREIDLFVLPSYHEGGPRAVLEASASGVAVVATDIAGCRAMVRHGETGLLVPARDGAALAAAIDELLADPSRRRQMGAAAREHMVKGFQQSHVLNQTLALYASLGIDIGMTVQSTAAPQEN